ncbi:MAG: rod shape-determining protein MreD [Bacteroidales bacterium]|jgi:cell shape-determining protein MreD|nr:rod shape-determining protein MreD [Bacteroidales bacterium]
MNKVYFKHILRFILLVALQLFFFNRIALWGMITPVVYIIFIFSLPFQTPRWLVILLGFAIGLTIDLFEGVIGLHALATLVMAFVRPMIIQIIPFKLEREEHLQPVFYDMKPRWYIQYAICMTLIHHIVFFFADVLSLHNFLRTLLVIFGNTLCSLACILLIQILFYKPSKRY